MTPGPDDGDIRVCVSADSMRATLVIDAGVAPGSLTEDRIRNSLSARGVEASMIVPARISEALARHAAHPGERIELLIAQGRPPVPARGERFEPESSLGLVQDTRPGADARHDLATIDEFVRLSHRCVEPERLLGFVRHASPGHAGVDVLGRSTPPPRTDDRRPQMDSTVRVGADGAVVAAVGGLPLWTTSGLRIVRTLRIPEVNFSSGNIDFPGNAEIEGGVRDGFAVRVGGTMIIGDVVEASTIVVGRSADLRGGMAGRGKGSITAGRDLRAKYLESATVRVGRDLCAETVISHCSVMIGRRLNAPRCALIGGEMSIPAGGDIGTVGTEAGIPTRIILARLAPLDDLGRKLAALLPRLRDRASHAQERLDQLRALTGKQTAAQAELLTELQFEATSSAEKLSPAENALRDLVGYLKRCTCRSLIIHRSVNPGVIVEMGRFRVEVRSSLEGPISVEAGHNGAPVVTDLRTAAAVPLAEFADVRTTDPEEWTEPFQSAA